MGIARVTVFYLNIVEIEKSRKDFNVFARFFLLDLVDADVLEC